MSSRSSSPWPAGPGPGQGLLLRLATMARDRGAAHHRRGRQCQVRPHGRRGGRGGRPAAGRRRVAVGLARPTAPFRLRGFHAFGASNVRDAAILVEAARGLGRRAEPLADRTASSRSCWTAAVAWASPTPMARRRSTWSPWATAWRRRSRPGPRVPRWPAAACCSSPGAGWSGPAGAYLCRVVRTKERGGRHVAVTDGGIHHLMRPRLVGQEQRVVPVGEAAARRAPV